MVLTKKESYGVETISLKKRNEECRIKHKAITIWRDKFTYKFRAKRDFTEASYNNGGILWI